MILLELTRMRSHALCAMFTPLNSRGFLSKNPNSSVFHSDSAVPVCFSNIFPVSSTMCVSHYNSLVSGNRLTGNGVVSKPGIVRLKMETYKQMKEEESINEHVKKASHDIKEWKKKGVELRDLHGINTIGGVMIMPESYGWVSFDLPRKRVLDYGGELLPLVFIEPRPSPSEFHIIACDIRNHIPDCDLYIMEIPKFYPKRKQMSDIEHLLTSKLVALLNPECDSAENLPGKVILQRQAEINSFFRLLVKNERISAYQKIQRITGYLNDHNVTGEEIAVNFSPLGPVKLRSDFLTSEENECELVFETISLALMLILSYLGRHDQSKFINKCEVKSMGKNV